MAYFKPIKGKDGKYRNPTKKEKEKVKKYGGSPSSGSGGSSSSKPTIVKDEHGQGVSTAYPESYEKTTTTDNLGQGVSTAYAQQETQPTRDKFGQGISTAYNQRQQGSNGSNNDRFGVSTTYTQNQPTNKDKFGQGISTAYAEKETQQTQRSNWKTYVNQDLDKPKLVKSDIVQPKQQTTIKQTSTISAANPELIKAQQESIKKESSWTSNFLKGLWQGEDYTEPKYLTDEQKQDPVYKATKTGAFLGAFTLAVPAGKSKTAVKGGQAAFKQGGKQILKYSDDVLKTTWKWGGQAFKTTKDVGKTAITKTGDIYKGFKQNKKATIEGMKAAGMPTGRIATLGSTAVSAPIVGYGFLEGTDFVSEVTAPEGIKANIKNKDFEKAVFGHSLEKAQEDKGIMQGIAGEVSIFLTDKKAYKQEVLNIAEARGLQGKEKENFIKAADRMRTTRGTGEALGLLTSSASVEVGGQGFMKAAFKVLGDKGTTATTKTLPSRLATTTMQIAPVGAIEGATQEALQQDARERERNWFKIENIGVGGLKVPIPSGIATEGAAGAVSSSVIMGGLSWLKYGEKAKPKALQSSSKIAVGNVLEVSANIMDIWEYPADKLAWLYGKTKKRITGKDIPKPKIFNIEQTYAFTPNIVPETKDISVKNIIKPVPQDPKNRIPIKDVVSTKTRIPSSGSDKKTKSKSSISIFPFDYTPDTPTPTPTKPAPVTPTIPTETPANTLIDNINNNVATETPITTNTNTNTNIFSISTPISIPTMTPQMRIPPPIPLKFPSTGGVGSRKGKRTKFVDELQLGKNLFKGLTFGSGIPQRRAAPKRKATKKRTFTRNKGIDPMKFLFG